MYDYMIAMKEDIRNAIKEYEYDLKEFSDIDEFREKLYDDLFVSDSVTGNASGSYFCNSYKAKEAVTDNMDLLGETIQEFCIESKEIGERFMNGDWEWMDVSIRCYLIGRAIDEVLEEDFNEEDFLNDEEQEEE